jgi:hypothetical protein
MYICILVVLEFERRDLHLLGRCSSTWVTPPSPFLLLVMFQAGFYIFVQSWPPAYGLPCSWNDKNMPPCPVHLLRSGLTNFLPRLFLNWNLLISVCFPRPRITGMNHYVQPMKLISSSVCLKNTFIQLSS